MAKKMTMAEYESSTMDRAADKSGKHGKEGGAKDKAADKKALTAINKTRSTDTAKRMIEAKRSTGYSAKKAAAGKDIGKPGKNFAKIAASAGKEYGSKAAGERVAGAVLAKLRARKG